MRPSYLPSERKNAAEVIALIEAEGRQAINLPGDINDEDWRLQTVDQAVSELGEVVTNADCQRYRKDTSRLTSEDFDKTLETNLYAMHWLAPGGRFPPARGRLGPHRRFGSGQ